MRLAIDLTALDDNFTGIERYAQNMALALLRLGKKPDITFELVFKNKVYPTFLEWEKESNVRFHVLKGCSKLFFNQWRLPMYLNRLRADSCLFLAFPMPVLLFRSHVYGTIHDMGCWDCPETMKRQMVWYFRISYRLMARRAERILTISEFSKKRIMEILKVKSDRILLAYCGISENFRCAARVSLQQQERIREKYGLPEEYYLCLSTLEPRKNLRLALDAYLRLYRQGRLKAKLVLAGRRGWKIDQLLEEIRQINVDAGKQKVPSDVAGDGKDKAAEDPVIVTGFIEDEDLPAVYQMATCFIFPSLYEGFGIPPLEAMSQGVPVISSDSSSLPEVLGEAAIYFKNRSEPDLERALLKADRANKANREQENTENARSLANRIMCGYERCRIFRYEDGARKVLEEMESVEKPPCQRMRNKL